MHPRPRRQYIPHWMALCIFQIRLVIHRTSGPPAGRTTAGHRPLTEQPLPGLSAPKGGAKRGRRPAQFCGIRPIKATPIGTRPPVRLRPDPPFPRTLAHTDTGKFRHLSAPQKDFVLGCCGVANARILFDGRQESTNETHDRSWRRWIGFCAQSGFASNPLLTSLSQQEIAVVAKAFVLCFQNAKWNISGKLIGRLK
jgi:hypothetical protein